MYKKGDCLWHHDHNNGHLIIILSEPNNQDDYLIVPIITLQKHHADRLDSFTCPIRKVDAPHTLKVDSTLSYAHCKNVSHDELNSYQKRQAIGTTLLKRCQDGAQASKALKPIYIKYFSDF